MPQFKLNGTVIELVPQERNVFGWLASQVYRKLFAEGGPPLPGMLAMLALDAPNQKVEYSDPRAQVVLWTLYQLGFDAAETIEAEKQVKWHKGTHPDISSRPLREHFTEEGMKDGRALAAGLTVVQQRTIRVNGTELLVRTVDFELLKAQAEEMKKRHTNPETDMALAAARYVAELISSGATDADLRLRAALELAADLGIRALQLDPSKGQVRIEAFNEAAALAAAYFQNIPLDQFDAAIKRAQGLNAAAAQTNKQAQASGGGGAGGVGGVGGGAGGRQPVGAGAGNAQQVNLSFKRRRR